jgi:hypothetical protein
MISNWVGRAVLVSAQAKLLTIKLVLDLIIASLP